MTPRAALCAFLAAAALSGCAVTPLQVRRAEDARAAGSRTLRKALSRGEPRVRLMAALAMGRIQDPGYAPDLLAALKGGDEALRAEAAFSLGQLRIDEPSEPSPGLTAGLMTATAGPSPAVRAAAAGALGKSGGAGAEERLQALLKDPEPAVRREAAAGLFRLRYLKRIPAYSTETVHALLHGIGDRDLETRWLSAYAFSRWPEPRAAAALAASASHPDAWVRLFSLRALAQTYNKESGDPQPMKSGAPQPDKAGPAAAPAPQGGGALDPDEARAIEAASRAMADPDERVRTEAAVFMGSAGSSNLIPDAVAQDPSHHVRAAAAAALEKGGSLKLLEQLAKDPSPLVRGQAVLSLGRRLKDQAWDRLGTPLRDTSWWVRSRAYLAAAEMPKLGAPVLEQGLKDGDVRVRAAALEGLSKIADARSVEVVAKALRDAAAPLEMRGAAVEAVQRLKSPALFEALAAAYRNSMEREFVEARESVVDAAEALAAAAPGDGAIAAFRESLLQDPAPSVQAKAARSLGRPAPPPPEPEPSPFLRMPPARAKSVILVTDKGEIEIELAADDAPVHAASIERLVRRQKYDGTPWHRVVSNFVVQGGDPRGTGWGDAGYSLRDEINRLRFDRGTVGMPKSGKDTGGCQLFVTLAPAPHLDGRYTALGRVVRGMEVADRLEPGDLIRRAELRE